MVREERLVVEGLTKSQETKKKMIKWPRGPGVCAECEEGAELKFLKFTLTGEPES